MIKTVNSNFFRLRDFSKIENFEINFFNTLDQSYFLNRTVFFFIKKYRKFNFFFFNYNFQRCFLDKFKFYFFGFSKKHKKYIVKCFLEDFIFKIKKRKLYFFFFYFIKKKNIQVQFKVNLNILNFFYLKSFLKIKKKIFKFYKLFFSRIKYFYFNLNYFTGKKNRLLKKKINIFKSYKLKYYFLKNKIYYWTIKIYKLFQLMLNPKKSFFFNFFFFFFSFRNINLRIKRLRILKSIYVKNKIKIYTYLINTLFIICKNLTLKKNIKKNIYFFKVKTCLKNKKNKFLNLLIFFFEKKLHFSMYIKYTFEYIQQIRKKHKHYLWRKKFFKKHGFYPVERNKNKKHQSRKHENRNYSDKYQLNTNYKSTKKK